MSLKIEPIDSKSTKLKSNPYMDAGVIPKFGKGSAMIVLGETGSGKSTLVSNLVLKQQFFASVFKKKDTYFISPSAKLDDLAKQLKVPEKNKKDTGFIEFIDDIFRGRKSEIEEAGGVENVPPVLMIFDDITAERKLMLSRNFINLIVMGRHLGFFSILIAHKLKAIPRTIRMNTLYYAIFSVSTSEMVQLYEERGTTLLSKREFVELISHTLDKRFNFFYIDWVAPIRERYRRNFDQILYIK